MYDANSTARIQRLFDKKIIPLAHNVSSFDIKYSTATGRSFLSAFASDFACELTPFAPTLTTFLAATTIVVIVQLLRQRQLIYLLDFLNFLNLSNLE